MRKILFIVLLFVCTGMSAQSEKKQVYCTVRYYIGEGKIEFPNDPKTYCITNEDGDRMMFNSLGHLITWMTERKWSYVDLYAEKELTGTAVWALMKKDISDESEIKEGISVLTSEELLEKYKARKKKKD